MAILNRTLELIRESDKMMPLISEITGLSEVKTRELIQREIDCIGSNVSQAVREFSCSPSEWSPEMIKLYSQSNAFLYETFVYNLTNTKESLRHWIRKYLRKTLNGAPAKLLFFGDGLGIDSAYFAIEGHDVTYYEISESGQAFASALFKLLGANIRMLNKPSHIPLGEFDFVISLDVLEHVPEPWNEVQKMAMSLKPARGRLIINAPYWYLSDNTETHLKSNLSLSGNLLLYRSQGFIPEDCGFFWTPIVFRLMDEDSAAPGLSAAFRIRMNQLLLILARMWPTPASWVTKQRIRAELKSCEFNEGYSLRSYR